MGFFTTTRLTFVRTEPEDAGVRAFVFRPDRKPAFKAGQHGFFTLPGAGTKPFSLASAPEDDEVLIGTRLQSGSPYKLALAALAPGDPAVLRGPVQNFTLDGSAPAVVFLAQGVGITPVRSLLRHIMLAGMDKDTSLIHVGGAHPFRADTEAIAGTAHYPTDAESFRVHLKEIVLARPGATYYLSGAKSFLGETTALLAEHQIPSRRIKKDRFIGY